MIIRNSHPEVFLWKGVLKICIKFTGEHPRRSAISIKLLCNFIKIALWHRCSLVNLLHVFRIPFTKNTSKVKTPLDGCFCIYLFSSCLTKFVRQIISQFSCLIIFFGIKKSTTFATLCEILLEFNKTECFFSYPD